MSRKHVNAACPATCLFILSMLLDMPHVYVACPYCMYLLFVHASGPCYLPVLHVHAARSCCVSVLHVHAACPGCMCMRHVHNACAWCMSMLHVLAACPFCMSLLHAHANAACSSCMPFYAACPCWMYLKWKLKIVDEIERKEENNQFASSASKRKKLKRKHAPNAKLSTDYCL
jgi:hypothetical protein